MKVSELSTEGRMEHLNQIKERLDNGETTDQDTFFLWETCWYLEGVIMGMQMADRHDHSGRCGGESACAGTGTPAKKIRIARPKSGNWRAR